MGVIEVTDFIICPNCGKKININTTKVVTADFFRYMICPECNGKFTKIPDSSRFYIKMHKISIYMLRILIIILTIISIYNSVNNDKSNLNYTIFQGIMLILVLILFIAVSHWQRNYAISRAFFCKPILSTTPGINFRSTNPLLILLIHKIN